MTRTSATWRTVRPWTWLPSAPKSRSPTIRAAAACMAPDVEAIVDLERPMPVKRPRDAAGPDPIAIDAQARRRRGSKPARRRAERPHRQVRRQDGIQPSPQLGQPPADGQRPSEAECRDLAGGMHPGIGSPGETDASPLADQPVKGLLQLSLHGPSVRLDLRAGEGRPVVLDGRPRASLRPGGHRSVSVFCWLPVVLQTSSIWTIGAASPGRCPSLMMRVKPRGAIGVLGRDLAHQLLDDERLVRHLADELPPRVEVAALRERDHAVHHAPDLLGLRLGGLDALVAQHGHGEVAEHGDPVGVRCG